MSDGKILKKLEEGGEVHLLMCEKITLVAV